MSAGLALPLMYQLHIPDIQQGALSGRWLLPAQSFLLVQANRAVVASNSSQNRSPSLAAGRRDDGCPVNPVLRS
jgi:hypothetical protein